MNDVSEELQSIRSKICNEMLLVSTFIAIPTLAMSLYRATSIGWQPLMTIQIVGVVTLWLVTLFRGSLPYGLRTGYLIAGMLLVGMGGLWHFGLAAGGVPFLVGGAVLAAILLGGGFGLAISAAAIMSVVAIGFITVLEKRLPEFDLTAYATQPEAWATLILALALTIGVILAALTKVSNYLISALKKTRLQEEKLHESEREYRNILDNMVDTFYRADLNGCAAIASPSVMGLLGYSPEELIGRKLTDFYVNADRRTEFLDHLQESGGKVNDFEAKIYRKDGSWIWVSTNAHFWKDINGNILGVEGVIRDITAHKEIEDALRQSQKLEAVGQLTGGIAHDFNNLMAIMMGNLELAMEQVEPDAPLRNNIENALKALGRGAGLTQQLLSFSRQQALSPAVTDVKQLVEGTLTFLERTLSENIQIVTKHVGEESRVNIDSAVFGNALVNLALNARDAMPDGGTLTVRTSTVELTGETIGLDTEPAYGPHALITVADTGSGISQGDLEQVLEPFFTTKEVGKGSGLGLSMVYGFVTQSNGHLNIASTKGEGTTVSLYFPISDEERVDKDNEAVPFSKVNIRKTILIVEDDQQVRETTSATLIDLGYKVMEAEDGPSALEILNKRSSDIVLVFSDVVMPNGMSGIDLARQITVDHKHIKVLLTSGYPDRIAEENDINSLEIMLLAKPFRRAQLAAAVENAALDRTEN